MFRRLTLAAAAAASVVLVASSASAADLGRRSSTNDYYDYGSPAIYDAASNWTGFYAGLNGGRMNGHVTESNPAVGPSGTLMGEFDPKGWFIGGTVGYNWQPAQRWIVGIEADLQYGKFGATRSDSYADPLFSVSQTQTIGMDFWGTARVRAGYLLTPSWLIYGTGGAVFGKVKTSDSYTATAAGFGTYTSTMTTSDWRVGYALGAGTEYAINRSWSLKGEYLYLDLGTRDNRFTYSGPGYSGASTDTTKLNAHVFRVGVNYHF